MSFSQKADIPGLAEINEKTLVASARLHNQFPSDTTFPYIDVRSSSFKALCAIFVKYNAQTYLRLRLLHRHMTIPEGYIMLSTSMRTGYWTTPERIANINLQTIHGHIYSLDTTNCTGGGEERSALLFPSEFRVGPPVAFGKMDGRFFKEFTDFLWMNGFEDILGLEVIQGQAGKMIEFSFDIGSLLIEDAEVRGQLEFRETGWTITVRDGAVDKGEETRCAVYSNVHLRVGRAQVKGALDALETLRDEGVLA